VRNQITEAQKIAGGSGSEQDIAEAKIELEVCAVAALARYQQVKLTFHTGFGELAGGFEIESVLVRQSMMPCR